MSLSSSSDFDRRDFTHPDRHSRYAVYIFSTNKHASNSECSGGIKEDKSMFGSEIKTSDSEEPNICLSLLDGNVEAEQETVVRCYLLKTLSTREDSRFENEGKCATLKFNDEAGGSFGCYYHRLSKTVHELQDGISSSPKNYTFFISLIGPTDIIESFCPELGKFCYKLVPLLDPEGLKDQNDVQQKLQMWHYYCVEYLERCTQLFKKELTILFQSSLWGNINIITDDENMKWDLERLVETCSLISMLPKDLTLKEETKSFPIPAEMDHSMINLSVHGEKLVADKEIGCSTYCLKWVEKLLACQLNDYLQLKSILEDFRLKTVQELNTLKRLLQKAENDQYSLYRAYKFLQNSSYEDILLHHVKHEARLANSGGAVEVIDCLVEFMQNKKSDSANL